MTRLLIYPLVIFLYILATLFPAEYLNYAVGISAQIALFLSFIHARGLYLYSGIVFCVTGIVLFYLPRAPWHQLFLHFDTMIGILALFLLLPFLNSLILVGRYDQNLSKLLEYSVKSVGDLYQRGAIVTHILGLFLNIATIPLLYQSMRKSLSGYSTAFSNRFFSKNLLRAYALCLMWSPMEILIIQTLDITGTSYLSLAPLLLVLTISILAADIYISRKRYHEYPIARKQNEVTLPAIFTKIKELFLLLIMLVAVVSLLNHVIDRGYLFALVLCIIPISLLWAFKLGKIKRYLTHCIPHWKHKTMGLANYFFMFLCAGFFVSMIGKTSWIHTVQQLLIEQSDHIIILFVFIGAYFVITSYLGFHPLVSIVLLGEMLRPVLSEVAGIPLSIVLIICSLSTVMYSPFNVSITILANEMNRNVYVVGFRNLPFAFMLMASSISFAYIIHLIAAAFL